MCEANVSKLEATPVLALIIGAFRAERFNEGIIFQFLNNGCLIKWIKRLKKIDDKI